MADPGNSWQAVLKNTRGRKDLSAEAQESLLLEAVARERLVKTQHTGKDLPDAVVNCQVWRLATAL
jgi:hypothetical protein